MIQKSCESRQVRGFGDGEQPHYRLVHCVWDKYDSNTNVSISLDLPVDLFSRGWRNTVSSVDKRKLWQRQLATYAVNAISHSIL